MTKLTSLLRLGSALLPAFVAFSPKSGVAEHNKTEQFVVEWLKKGPLAGKDNFTLEDNQRCLSTMFLVRQTNLTAQPNLTWMKATSLEESKGSFYPKKVVGPFTLATYAKGQVRREHLRILVDQINAKAGEILIAPRKKGMPEYLLSDKNAPYPLKNNIITFWEHIEGQTNPLCTSNYLWTPTEYPKETIHELVCLLDQTSTISRQIFAQAQDPASLEKALEPEWGSAVCANTISSAKELFSHLGIHQTDACVIRKELDNPHSSIYKGLQAQAKKVLQAIEEKKDRLANLLKVSPKLSLTELKKQFLEKTTPSYRQALNPIAAKEPQISFLHSVFSSEREGIWADHLEAYQTARALAQLTIAEEIATDILQNNAELTTKLLKQLCCLERHYNKLKNAPIGLVQGNAHPYKFMLKPNGRWAILSNERGSAQFFLKDLAVEFIGKITRSYVRNHITKETALEYLQAALIPEWIEGYGADLLSCYILDLASELRTLSYAYSLDDERLFSLNLTISARGFTNSLQERIECDRVYRSELYPAWKQGSI